ncbi:glycoside hydrolase [Cladochytrium replicatum]|nr:glycoside hydrolase [Cladochytrium replicatum]
MVSQPTHAVPSRPSGPNQGRPRNCMLSFDAKNAVRIHRTSHFASYPYKGGQTTWTSLWIVMLCMVAAMSPPLAAEDFRTKAKEMFYHGFNGYMQYAFPLDELNPVNCSGRGPDYSDDDNWNINDVLGNFSLTLVDSLDTFAVMGDKLMFHRMVQLTIDTVHFDVNSRVQVFEVTIRVLGSLLSAHLFLTNPELGMEMEGYKGELLKMAKNLADRLLPAFYESPTSFPYPRVNLKVGVVPWEANSTCTAGAGTLLLEFGVLSRLTGNPEYEHLARKALFELWERRSRLDLVGNTLSVQDSSWINGMAGIGAGIDSYFEYLLKGSILFGDDGYHDIFIDAYEAILAHIKDPHGYVYKNVNMDTGRLAVTWVDSLAAFFPGLQVLAGDLTNAVKHHWFYFTIWKRYRALPERFDFSMQQPSINNYPLRPELIESTYFLYQATRNPIYLEAGELMLKDLEQFTRTKCGFSSLSDVVRKTPEDRMESFFLSETIKYLYLLFDSDHFINKADSNWVFTTEGHILPVQRNFISKTDGVRASLPRRKTSSDSTARSKTPRTCPNTQNSPFSGSLFMTTQHVQHSNSNVSPTPRRSPTNSTSQPEYFPNASESVAPPYYGFPIPLPHVLAVNTIVGLHQDPMTERILTSVGGIDAWHAARDQATSHAGSCDLKNADENDNGDVYASAAAASACVPGRIRNWNHDLQQQQTTSRRPVHQIKYEGGWRKVVEVVGAYLFVRVVSRGASYFLDRR